MSNLITKQPIKAGLKGFAFTIPQGTRVANHTAFGITDPRYFFVLDFEKWLPLVSGVKQTELIKELTSYGYAVDTSLLTVAPNPIKAAYQAYDAYVVNDIEDIKKAEALARAVWLAVYDQTKGINPGLKGDIERGQYDSAISARSLCFLAKCWQVVELDHCSQCGEAHKS